MPTNVVRTPEQEEKWAKAKAIAEQQGQKDNYAYIMGIYKNMGGLEDKTASTLIDDLFEKEAGVINSVKRYGKLMTGKAVKESEAAAKAAEAEYAKAQETFSAATKMYPSHHKAFKDARGEYRRTQLESRTANFLHDKAVKDTEKARRTTATVGGAIGAGAAGVATGLGVSALRNKRTFDQPEKTAGYINNLLGKNISEAERNVARESQFVSEVSGKLKGLKTAPKSVENKQFRKQLKSQLDFGNVRLSDAKDAHEKAISTTFKTRLGTVGALGAGGALAYSDQKKKKDLESVEPNYNENYQPDNYMYMTAGELIDALMEKKAIYRDSKGVYHFDLPGDDGLMYELWDHEEDKAGKVYDDMTREEQNAISDKAVEMQNFADEQLRTHPLLKQYEEDEAYNDERNGVKSKVSDPVRWGIGAGIPAGAMTLNGIFNKKIMKQPIRKNMGKTLFLSAIPAALAATSAGHALDEAKRKREGYGPERNDAWNKIYDDVYDATHEKFITEGGKTALAIDILFEKIAEASVPDPETLKEWIPDEIKDSMKYHMAAEKYGTESDGIRMFFESKSNDEFRHATIFNGMYNTQVGTILINLEDGLQDAFDALGLTPSKLGALEDFLYDACQDEQDAFKKYIAYNDSAMLAIANEEFQHWSSQYEMYVHVTGADDPEIDPYIVKPAEPKTAAEAADAIWKEAGFAGNVGKKIKDAAKVLTEKKPQPFDFSTGTKTVDRIKDVALFRPYRRARNFEKDFLGNHSDAAFKPHTLYVPKPSQRKLFVDQDLPLPQSMKTKGFKPRPDHEKAWSDLHKNMATRDKLQETMDRLKKKQSELSNDSNLYKGHQPYEIDSDAAVRKDISTAYKKNHGYKQGNKKVTGQINKFQSKIDELQPQLDHSNNVVNEQYGKFQDYKDNELAKSLGLYGGLALGGKITYDVGKYYHDKKGGQGNAKDRG